MNATLDSLATRAKIHMVIAHNLGGALALQLFSIEHVRADKALLLGTSFGPKNIIRIWILL
jgi:hypothetical protein